jgi:hypothetical protein
VRQLCSARVRGGGRGVRLAPERPGRLHRRGDKDVVYVCTWTRFRPIFSVATCARVGYTRGGQRGV